MNDLKWWITFKSKQKKTLNAKIGYIYTLCVLLFIYFLFIFIYLFFRILLSLSILILLKDIAALNESTSRLNWRQGRNIFSKRKENQEKIFNYRINNIWQCLSALFYLLTWWSVETKQKAILYFGVLFSFQLVNILF